MFLKDIESFAITKQDNLSVASLKNLYMSIWKLMVRVILESSALTKRFPKKKMLKKLLFLFCNWYVIDPNFVILK